MMPDRACRGARSSVGERVQSLKIGSGMSSCHVLGMQMMVGVGGESSLLKLIGSGVTCWWKLSGLSKGSGYLYINYSM